MNITFTFFVQIIHFYMIYLFLDKVLFFPFFNALKNKAFSCSLIQQKQQEKELLLTQLQQEKLEQLTQFQEYIKASYKEPKKQEFVQGTLHEQEISEESIIYAKKSMQELIIKEIKHAH